MKIKVKIKVLGTLFLEKTTNRQSNKKQNKNKTKQRNKNKNTTNNKNKQQL